MPRFFLSSEYLEEKALGIGDTIEISGNDAQHIVNSLRMRKGERAIICSTGGIEYESIFSFFEKSGNEIKAYFEIEKITACENEPKCDITLYQGIPKGKKTDQIIQKCVEMGVSKIVFVYSDRSIPEYRSPNDEKNKAERFNRIAFEAAKQCGRGKLIEVSFMMSLDEAIADMKKSDISFFLYEGEKDSSIKNILKTDFSSASFFVGPEGGVSERECDILKQNGIMPYSLGKLILRTETAATALLAMVLYEKSL